MPRFPVWVTVKTVFFHHRDRQMCEQSRFRWEFTVWLSFFPNCFPFPMLLIYFCNPNFPLEYFIFSAEHLLESMSHNGELLVASSLLLLKCFPSEASSFLKAISAALESWIRDFCFLSSEDPGLLAPSLHWSRMRNDQELDLVFFVPLHFPCIFCLTAFIIFSSSLIFRNWIILCLWEIFYEFILLGTSLEL